MVIIQPSILIRSSNSGIAVISFDLLSTLTPAMEMSKSCRNAETI